jgi:hypothetical protein
MKLAPMRFKDFGWRHNPREIRFECDKQINEHLVPCGGAVVQNMGRKGVRVVGEGELFGPDCTAQFESLFELFRESGSGLLVIDSLPPFEAVFEELRLVGSPRDDVLTYRFEFREVIDETALHKTTSLTACGECLWDISYRFGIVIDELVRLNPQVRRPDLPLDGEVVALG